MRGSAHKPGAVLTEVPFGAGIFRGFVRAEAGENRVKIPGESLHQENVDVTRDIFKCSVAASAVLVSGILQTLVTRSPV